MRQYDQIDKDVRPFWALSPESFRERAKELKTDSSSL